MSFRVRPANGEDFRAIYQMAKLTGGGFTNLPADRDTLVSKLTRSEKSFGRTEDTQSGDLYVFVLEDPSVPAGNYARQAFAKAGLPAPKPVSNELDVKSTLAKLTSGDADAVIVYVTDVKAAGSKVEGVDIPDSQNVIATYPIAAIKASKNLTAAEAFVDEIVGGSGQQALQARGFLPPS